MKWMDTPPFPINEEALDIAYRNLDLLMHCNIVDEMHIARKQYLDGSIPTGFQRTANCKRRRLYSLQKQGNQLDSNVNRRDSCREFSDFGSYKNIYY